jgi:hypothetical protein
MTIKYMHPHWTNRFSWPSKEDILKTWQCDILIKLIHHSHNFTSLWYEPRRLWKKLMIMHWNLHLPCQQAIWIMRYVGID